jgi:hypothetical protein
MPPPSAPAAAASAAGGTSAAPAPSGAPAPAEKAGAKPKVEAAPNEELVGLFQKYDESVEKAESYFIDLVALIQAKQLDRATVVVSMMRARKITFETAQSQYSRMKKIFNNEEVLKELKEGKISLKVARERTTDKQANPKSAAPANKEQKYNAALKAFVAAAKEGGFALREIILGVEAELKGAGIK